MAYVAINKDSHLLEVPEVSHTALPPEMACREKAHPPCRLPPCNLHTMKAA